MGEVETSTIEFKCQDKDGVRILCTTEDWQHIIEHTECIGQQGLVKVVIGKPDSIYQDTGFKNRRVLYKTCVLASPWGSCYVRVVIEYSKNPLKKRGWVCTVFASLEKKKGEVLLWKKQMI